MDPNNNKSWQKLNLTQCIGGEGGVCVCAAVKFMPQNLMLYLC